MSRRLGYIFSVLTCAALTVPGAAQPFRRVDPVSGHTYEVSPTAELWTTAVTQAQTFSIPGSNGTVYQGYMTAISSQYENDFIQNFFPQFTNTVWIGLTDINSSGTYQWANGEPLTYTNWSPGEPNNSNGLEHYVQMFQGSGKWNDLPNTPLNYIIEYNTPLPNPPGVPEPGTLALTASLLTLGAGWTYRRRNRR